MFKEYKLNFASGHGWNLLVAEELFHWFEKVVAVLGIKCGKSSSFSSAVLSQGRLDRQSIDLLKLNYNLTLPVSGWKLEGRSQSFFAMWTHLEIPHILLEIGTLGVGSLDFAKTNQTLHVLYHHLYKSGCLPLHTALIAKDNKGCLLVATGNQGKTTCCRRVPSPWKAMCDDEALAVKTGVGQYYVHPFPTWSTWFATGINPAWKITQKVRLSAIFFLEKGTTDRVIPIGEAMAAWKIYCSGIEVYQKYILRDKKKDKEMQTKIMENSVALVKNIPIFGLQATLNGKFWREIEKSLTSFN